MKFLQLRDGLQKAGVGNEVDQTVTRRQSEDKPRDQKPNTQKEKVEGGLIKFKPIDSTAARVIAPASWIHKPPASESTMINPTAATNPETVKTFGSEDIAEIRRVSADAKYRAIGANIDASKLALQEIETIYSAGANALAALDTAAAKHASTTRQLRMSVMADMNQILRTLEDVRKFFIGPDHEREIQRLEHFIGLCERLEALKRNGTLDAVADTIIKLA